MGYRVGTEVLREQDGQSGRRNWEEGGATDNKGIHTWCQGAAGTILTWRPGPSFEYFYFWKAVSVIQSSLLLFYLSSMK